MATATTTTGWAQTIQEKLTEYGLEQDWEAIKNLSRPTWKSIVNVAIRAKNKQKLLDSCIQQEHDGMKIKTKTAYVYHYINNSTDTDNHEALPEILLFDKVDTKTIILARSGMLECGKNFKGTIPEVCRACGEGDSESHRLNRCITWRHLNHSQTGKEVDFSDVYSDDKAKLSQIIGCIQRLWEIRYGNGLMKKPSLRNTLAS